MTAQYITIQEVAKRATLAFDSNLTVVTNEAGLKLVDGFGNVVVYKLFVDNSQHLVRRLPFECYSNTEEDDEDFDAEFEEYLNDVLVPYCVSLDGHIVTLEAGE